MTDTAGVGQSDGLDLRYDRRAAAGRRPEVEPLHGGSGKRLEGRTCLVRRLPHQDGGSADPIGYHHDPRLVELSGRHVQGYLGEPPIVVAEITQPTLAAGPDQ